MHFNKTNKKEYLLLLSIVCIAIVFRLLAIWVWRPEFVGWFSHTYYYYVQVQGILQNGSLQYADMPFLFYFYSFFAKILILFGLETKLAIITSTRIIMAITPAFLAFPVFFLIKSINRGKELSKPHWILLIISVILPFSIAHMPEILQKNMFGLVLFTILQISLYRLLKDFNIPVFICVLLITTLIFLTHIGTFAVASLLFIALTFSYFINEGFSRRTISLSLSTLTFISISISIIYYLDFSRFERIFYYLIQSLSNSQIGKLFTTGNFSERLPFFGAIIFSTLLFFLLIRVYQKYRTSLAKTDRIFFLTNILLMYFLMFPFIDVDLTVRFILFISIPILIIQIYLLKCLEVRWLINSMVGVFILVCLIMATGETMGIIMRHENNLQIEKDIKAIQNKELFKPNDFIITNYGVNPLCNWFFETKSGLITSLEKKDFDKFDKIYILTPSSGQMSPDQREEISGKIIKTESDKYQIMRSNVLIPNNAKSLIINDNFEIFEIDSPPENWIFDSNGKWIGYAQD
jgi:hypothetical protein